MLLIHQWYIYLFIYFFNDALVLNNMKTTCQRIKIQHWIVRLLIRLIELKIILLSDSLINFILILFSTLVIYL